MSRFPVTSHQKCSLQGALLECPGCLRKDNPLENMPQYANKSAAANAALMCRECDSTVRYWIWATTLTIMTFNFVCSRNVGAIPRLAFHWQKKKEEKSASSYTPITQCLNIRRCLQMHSASGLAHILGCYFMRYWWSSLLTAGKLKC